MDLALQEGRVYLPPLVLSEILSGKMKPNEKARLIDFFKELPLSSCDFSHWVRVGELRATALSKGFTVSTPDAHVAQCAIDIEGYLVTEDSIFGKVSHAISLKLLSN